MSFQAVSYVVARATPTDAAERAVLFVLAHHAGRELVAGAWESWPSVGTVARETAQSRRTVQRAIRRMEKSGELQTIDGGGRRRPNRYRIPQERASRATPFKSKERASPVTPITGAKGVICGQERASPVTPEHIENNVRSISRVTRESEDAALDEAKQRHPSGQAWGEHYPDAITRARAALHGGEKTKPDDHDDEKGDPFP